MTSVDAPQITATVMKPSPPHIYLAGTIGGYKLNMPLTVEQATQMAAALDRALRELGSI